MLSGLLSAIKKALTKTDVKSKASEARSLVRKNPKMTGAKEQAAIDKINAALDAKLAQIKKAGETSKKAPPQGVAAARAKAGSNRQQAMTAEKKGSIATRTASSKTAIDEAKTLKDVGIARTKIREMEDADLRKFFLAELKKKEKQIERKQAGEKDKVVRKVTQAASDRKAKDKITLPQSFDEFKRDKDFEKAEYEYDARKERGRFKRGGVIKGKPRTGHTDMRMGGLFYK